MGRLKTELELQHTPAELQHHYQHARTAIERRRAQVIWFLATGKSFEETGALTAYSHVSVLKTIHNYNRHGLNGLKDQRANNQGAPTLLSDQQMLLLAQTIRHDFEQGIVWNGQDVLDWVKRKCKKDLHKPRAYELLATIQFTLQVPRPTHEKSNPAAVEDFKKRSSQKPSKRLEQLLMTLNSGPVTNTVSD